VEEPAAEAAAEEPAAEEPAVEEPAAEEPAVEEPVEEDSDAGASTIQPRLWVDASGLHRTMASLLGVDAESVTLQKTTGSVIRVPLVQLSDADRAYAAAQLPLLAGTR
jgi:hypothetical protein